MVRLVHIKWLELQITKLLIYLISVYQCQQVETNQHLIIYTCFDIWFKLFFFVIQHIHIYLNCMFLNAIWKSSEFKHVHRI